MRNSKDYLERLAGMKKNIYLDGKVIGRDDPVVVARSKAIQITFDKADDPAYKDLLTAILPHTSKPGRFAEKAGNDQKTMQLNWRLHSEVYGH